MIIWWWSQYNDENGYEVNNMKKNEQSEFKWHKMGSGPT